MKKIKSIEALRPYVPQRVIRLFEILETFNPEFQKERMKLEKAEHLSAIIFVDQRYIAYSLLVGLYECYGNIL